MTTIAFASIGRSPGVSFLCWQAAALWPTPTIAMEADPAGGCWALRHRGTSDPGLLQLAASNRSIGDDSLLEFSQSIGAQARVVCAPPSGSQTRHALAALEGRWRSAHQTFDLLLDLGRLGPWTSPALLASAQMIVFLARPVAEEIGPLQSFLSEYERGSQQVRYISIGGGEYSPEEIAAVLETPLAGRIPFDPVGASRLTAGDRRAKRSAVARAARTIVDSLAAETVFRPVADGVADGVADDPSRPDGAVMREIVRSTDAPSDMELSRS